MTALFSFTFTPFQPRVGLHEIGIKALDQMQPLGSAFGADQAAAGAFLVVSRRAGLLLELVRGLLLAVVAESDDECVKRSSSTSLSWA
jgi:hypothetical protein